MGCWETRSAVVLMLPLGGCCICEQATGNEGRGRENQVWDHRHETENSGWMDGCWVKQSEPQKELSDTEKEAGNAWAQEHRR